MQNFTSTPEERCRQEVNIILNTLDADLKHYRAQLLENYHFVVPKPVSYFISRMEAALDVAAQAVVEAQHYWKQVA